MNHRDPNSRLGGMSLMDLGSWLEHEEIMVEQVKIVMEKEEKEHLYIIVELMSPKVVTRNHSLISNDVVLAPKYFET